MDESAPKTGRRGFLRTLARTGAGVCCCAPALGLAAAGQQIPPQRRGDQGWIGDLGGRMVDGSRTPAWRRMEIAGEWIHRLMENMDELLDTDTRGRLMQACGRDCYVNAFGVRSEEPPPTGALDAFLETAKAAGETYIRREGDTVYYKYGASEQNPYGLRLQDGYCMCPLVESAPTTLSKTYCQCSAGYVREVFERMTGSPCRVELLESVRTGGKACRFKIDILGA